MMHGAKTDALPHDFESVYQVRQDGFDLHGPTFEDLKGDSF